MQVDSSTSVAGERAAVISSSGQTRYVHLAPTPLLLYQQPVVITVLLHLQATMAKTDNLLYSPYTELLVREVGTGADMVRTGHQEMTMKVMVMVVVVVEWDLEILEVEGPILILIQAMDRLLCVTVEWKLYREQCRRQDQIREGSFSLAQSQERSSVDSLNGQMMCHLVT